MKVKKSGINNKLSLMSPTYRFEADGGGDMMRLYLFGIIGIGELSDESIRLITRKQSITVSGKLLSVSVFEGNSLELVGKIENISLSSARALRGGRNGKNR